MSIRSRLALTAIVASLVASGTAAAAPSAAAADGTQIQSITITVGDRTLVGAQLTSVTVRVHLTDPVGVQSQAGAMYDSYWPCPCVAIASFDSLGHRWKASPQAWGERLISLTLASGTPQDGVWVGRSMLGAINAGFWKPTVIHAGTLVQPPQPPGEIPDGYDFVSVPADIATAGTVHVRGDDWPVITLTIPSTVTPYGKPFVIGGYAMTARTHRPVPGLRVSAIADQSDPVLHEAGTATRTTSTGRWAITSIDWTPYWAVLWAPDRLGQAVTWVTAHRAHVRAVILSRTVSATSVRVGRSITVSGKVSPAAGLAVVLQRYYLGAWRTVYRSTGYHGTYGYLLLASPPRGSWYYRVRVIGSSELYGTVGPVFVLRGV